MAKYPTPPGDGLEPLIRELKDIHTQLRDLQRPSGTNIGNTAAQVQLLVAKVEATLVNIDASVTASIAANSMTTAQINAKVASPGAISPTTVSASDAVSGTTGTFPTGMNSVGVYNKLLSYGGAYSSQYVHEDGTMGYAPSSRQYKQDITPAAVDPKLFPALRLVTFRYIAAVENLGVGAEVEVGLIAEEVHDMGLYWLVDYGSDGLPMGLKYERLALLVIPWAQSIEARLTAAGL